MNDYAPLVLMIAAAIILLAVIIIRNRRDKKKFIGQLDEEQEKRHAHRMSNDNI